ncbi:mycothiol conjugate amidase Mca [Frigoribacterium sp. Leaf186]|nr:mycothiol conjugate amidase Mca [Frigoribacterium sp. Leaf186]
MAVHAHPDDESSKGSATYAYYRSLGVEVLVVSCTGGEQGSILNEQLEARSHAERDIAGLRVHEMAAAKAAMRVDHLWLGYADSGLPAEGESVAVNSFATIPLEISAEPLVAIIRRFKPQVLVTYDENGGYPHPDHIRTHEISMAAYRDAADPERYPTTGDAWQIEKVYYDRMFSAGRIGAMITHLRESDPESPLIESLTEMLTRFSDRPDLATTRVPVSDFFPVRDAALRAHASQVPLDSAFFFWPHELQVAAWPTEDFQLVESTVGSELPEDDLFAGVTDPDTGLVGVQR